MGVKRDFYSKLFIGLSNRNIRETLFRDLFLYTLLSKIVDNCELRLLKKE